MEEFDSASEAICNDDSKIDGNIIFLTDVIYNACFSVFGRTVKIKKQSECKRKPATWFNDQCRTSKGIFLQGKRTFKSSNSEENKVAFLSLVHMHNIHPGANIHAGCTFAPGLYFGHVNGVL